MTGRLVAEAHFWDLKETRLIECEKCLLTQFDPMLSEDDTALGCHAYYLDELKRVDRHTANRNCIRNFRRGVAFAARLRSVRILPQRILEFGPGDGYFAAGMKFILADATFKVVDIVDTVLEEIEQVHGFETIKGTPESMDIDRVGKFDLVIARDIIEHTIDIKRVLSNVHELLVPGGHFHFLTPNGHEDRWGAYVRNKLTGEPAEILINHVNYFDPQGLESYLHQIGFETVNFYVDSIKGTRRGKGWKVQLSLAKPPTNNRSACDEVRNAESAMSVNIAKPDIRNEWWYQEQNKWISTSYCRFKNYVFARVPARLKIGHEINALMKRVR